MFEQFCRHCVENSPNIQSFQQEIERIEVEAEKKSEPETNERYSLLFDDNNILLLLCRGKDLLSAGTKTKESILNLIKMTKRDSVDKGGREDNEITEEIRTPHPNVFHFLHLSFDSESTLETVSENCN